MNSGIAGFTIPDGSNRQDKDSWFQFTLHGLFADTAVDPGPPGGIFTGYPGQA